VPKRRQINAVVCASSLCYYEAAGITAAVSEVSKMEINITPEAIDFLTSQDVGPVITINMEDQSI